jgi:HD-GYP domain-containing protein (c-di-GMP phosphodiesterase class II)
MTSGMETMRRSTPEVSDRSSTDVATNLSELAQRPSVERALEAMREFLGMDVAYTSELVGDQMAVRAFVGDAASFHVSEEMSLPSEQTYCHRVMAGRLPNVNPDIRGDDRAASLPITQIADIGAFTSVPLRFSDGRLYGTLCAASHDAMPSLGYRELQFLHVFARIVADQLEREEIQGQALHLESQASAAAILIAAVDARDSYTAEHSQAVVAHAVAVARDLGLSVSEIREVEQTALLHDIGKIAVPDAILQKSGPLTGDEWEVMRAHPACGQRLIGNVPHLADLAPMIRAEHERWDGGGYPDGLAGEQIPLASRITLVCDAYHAMTSDRPYRKAMSPERARAEIVGGVGTQFCPTAAQALLRVLDA